MYAARMKLPGGHKYRHNGGMALAYDHGVGLQGVQDGDDGPFLRTPETRDLQGKRPWGPGSAPLGAAMDSLQGPSHRQEVLPQRGHVLRQYPASACQGVQDGHDGPSPRSAETAVMQGKVRGGP
jgi:hypothetical protein